MFDYSNALNEKCENIEMLQKNSLILKSGNIKTFVFSLFYGKLEKKWEKKHTSKC